MSNAEIFVPSNGELNGVNGFTEQPAAQPTGQPADLNGFAVGQPGSSKAAAAPAGKGTLVMDYSTDFPKLPETKAPAPSAGGAWARRPLTLATVTETFKLSADERATMNLGSKSFGQAEQQKCSQVANATNTKIELCEGADKSLTVLITGKKADVNEAHARLVRELQTQASIEVTVPRDYHGSIIGRDGQRRKELESRYHCRFFMPGREEHSDIVRIVGPMEQVKEAAQRLREIVSDLASRSTETLQIPRTFYPWIRGAFNETVDAIQAETGVKINIPPPRSTNETIVISGEREGVAKAAAKVRAIYDAKKNVVKAVTCKVNRSQHRFIIGQKGSGLDEIFRETEVVVEVPPEEENSDNLTLRGPQEKLGEALTLVYSRASSIISLQLEYPEWQRPFLLGKKGSKLQELVPKQDRLNVEFEDGGVIYIEGPPEAVKNASVALRTEIERLTKEMAIDSVKVPAYLHRHIIGRQGASISKIKNDFDVQITIPDESSGSEEIRIEGRKENVKKAVAEIKEQAAKLEQKMPKDQQPPATPAEELERATVDVDPKYHKHFVARGAEVIRDIQQRYPGVIISFPRQETNDSKVQLRGPKSTVGKAKKEVETIAADLAAQITANVEIDEQHHRSLIPLWNSNRLDYGNIRVQFPPKGTTNEPTADGTPACNVVTLTGRPEHVEAAKAFLLKSVPVSKAVNVPAEHHSMLIGRKGESIKTLMTNHQVRVKFPANGEESDEIVISGPADNVDAAVKELHERVEDLEKQAEDRRLRSFKTSVEVPTSFHSRLIGAGGANIRDFSKKWDVQIHIPRDNSETININGYEEKANAAKAEIERLVEEFKNMVTLHVNLDPRFHPRLIGQRRKNLSKIEQDFGCEITIPGRNDEDPSRVLVSGKTEEAVLDCIDKLRTLEEDFMQDVVDSSRYEYHRPQQKREVLRPQHIEITNAPWQLDSEEMFPSMGGGQNEQPASNSQPTGVWGRRR